MSRRLNLWDFDDTLAWSKEVVDRLALQHPDVQIEKWWHDDHYSTLAALETLPVEPVWKTLGSTPGDHWILTGRNRKAVMEWVEVWKDNPDIGKYVSQINKVISTSNATTDKDDIGIKKRGVLERLVLTYDEIHVYDDRRKNLEAMASVSDQVTLHLVSRGRIVKASEDESGAGDEVYKDLQILANALTAIQGLEMVSEEKTYAELFRSTIGIIKKVQSDLIGGMSTTELMDYTLTQLKKSKITLDGDVEGIVADLDRGHQVPVVFSFKRRLKDFYGKKPRDIYRAVYTIGLSIETIFDKLQSPLICTVGKRVYSDERLPTGFEATLWRIK